MERNELNEDDFEFVCMMTHYFDRNNPNHVQAATHLLVDLKLPVSQAITHMSGILQMKRMDDAFFYDTSSPSWQTGSKLGISAQTQDLLIDLLGKRPLMDKYRAKGNAKKQKANEDLFTAKEICTQIQQVVPHIVTDDPERLNVLQQKYIATVAFADDASKSHAFFMSEYLYFLDTLLHNKESARILGKAVLQAWIYSGKAHQQDQSVTDARFQRMIWLSRMHGGYFEGKEDQKDKVHVPQPYFREFGFLPSKDAPYPWDDQGDLSETMKHFENHCVYCHQTREKVLNCGACKKARYCSKDCQKSHWKSGHKHLCKAWRASASEPS